MRRLGTAAAAFAVLACYAAGTTVGAHEHDDHDRGHDYHDRDHDHDHEHDHGHDNDRRNIPAHATVAFGAGLNTAQPGNELNEHIVPQNVTVRITKARKLDGTQVFVPATVNFLVSGFHWVWVYNAGVTLKTVKDHAPAAGLYVNYDVNVFAKGPNPGTPPAFADRDTNPSGVLNHTASFGFSVPGRYLVICNVLPHFQTGMYAWINVVDGDDD